MPPYTKFTWVDEVLAAAARYDILEDGGGAFKSDMQINLATTVTTPGSTFTAASLNNIEGEIQALSDLLNYKLAVSVSANDLIVTLQHADGTNPTSTRPLYFKIGGVWRAVTTTTTITIVDGTNWFNSGSPELGTKLVPYFVYVVWDPNLSVVALSIARSAWGRLVSDFSSTTTNEKHLYNYADFTTTDPVANIGYLEATLSLVATSHLWTVPTFTNTNLRSEPSFELRAHKRPFGATIMSGTLTTGDGKIYFPPMPAELNGMNIVSVIVTVRTASTSGTPTFQFARGRQSSPTSAHTYVDILSTRVTIDANEYSSLNATTAYVIDTANDDLATGDLIRCDIDVIGTGTADAYVTFEAQLP